MPVIRYSSPLGMLTLEADTNGLTGLYLPRRTPSSSTTSLAPDGDPILDEARCQLDQYFAGKRQAFSLPLAPHGTSFQRRVWAALQTIPYGHTASYQTISNAIGNPKANQAVGGANSKKPDFYHHSLPPYHWPPRAINWLRGRPRGQTSLVDVGSDRRTANQTPQSAKWQR